MIIWIASYPKSGNTWVRSLLSTYLYQDDGNFNFDLLYKIGQFPNKKSLKYFLKDFSDIKKVSDYWIAAQDRINLFNENKTIFLKTHSALCTLENNSFTNKNNTKAVIYIVRDPRNVITSLSNHFAKNIEESYQMITKKSFMLTDSEWGGDNFGGVTIIGSWSEHFKSWQKIKFAPILIIKYENLINDTANSLIAIIKFLKNYIDVEIDNKKILKTINSCAFDNLVSMEKKFGFQEGVYSKKDNKKINFFYLGKKNDWKNLLNPEIEKKIRIEFNKEMKELDYI